MGFIDFFASVFSPAVRATRFNGLNEIHRDEKPHVDPVNPVGIDPVEIPDRSIRETIALGPAGPGEHCDLPQRYGTFLLVDLYPGDLRGRPDWEALERNSRFDNVEVVGAILKATEGISYRYTDWFVREGRRAREMWQGRLGRDRFMGSYHYLQLRRDGAKQAEYFVRTMEKINMPQGGVDIHPALDFEQGGQVGFFPSDCPKDEEGRHMLHLLPDGVKRDLAKRAMETVRKCAERFRELTGFKPMLYGRGLQRDLGMTTIRGYTQDQLRMGCVKVWNPAYTSKIVRMEAYGWPIEDVPLWQYCGGGDEAHAKLPNGIPGFSDDVDLNVHIDGSNRTSLASFRKALVLP